MEIDFFIRYKDGNSYSKGSYEPNPFLDTLSYDIEFPNGEIKEHLANVTA